MYIDHSEKLAKARKCRELARANNLTVSVGPNAVTFLGTADYETTFTDRYMSINNFIKQYAS